MTSVPRWRRWAVSIRAPRETEATRGTSGRLQRADRSCASQEARGAVAGREILGRLHADEFDGVSADDPTTGESRYGGFFALTNTLCTSRAVVMIVEVAVDLTGRAQQVRLMGIATCQPVPVSDGITGNRDANFDPPGSRHGAGLDRG